MKYKCLSLPALYFVKTANIIHNKMHTVYPMLYTPTLKNSKTLMLWIMSVKQTR